MHSLLSLQQSKTRNKLSYATAQLSKINEIKEKENVLYTNVLLSLT